MLIILAPEGILDERAMSPSPPPDSQFPDRGLCAGNMDLLSADILLLICSDRRRIRARYTVKIRSGRAG